MNANRLTGREAEARSAEYLRGKGYEIIAMNYACRGGEIDIIAAQYEGPALLRRFSRPKRGYIVFAEVKLRSDALFGRPREAVTRRKQGRIRLAAGLWLSEHETELQPRFDVIEVLPGDGGLEFEHIENAF